MIISHAHRFIFIHIPKCAGTFVRRSLAHYDDDGRFVGGGDTPPFGIIDRQHLPLDFLRAHFPEVDQLFRTYSSFAVLRDVGDRFRSSCSQFSKTQRNTPFAGLPFEDQRELVRDLLQRIPDGVAQMDYRFAHFIPQHRFVEDEGRRVVQHLFLASQLAELAAFLDGTLGIKMNTAAIESRNASLLHRSELGKPLESALRKAIPGALVRQLSPRLKARARRLLYRPVAQSDLYPEFEQDVAPFLTSFYARDLELVRRVTDRTATP